MKSFLIRIIALTVLNAAIGGLLFSMYIPQYYLPVFPFVLIFFAVISVAIYAYQLKMAQKDIGKFTRSNMILTFVKLVVYSAFVIIYMAIDTKNAKVFVIGFMFIYLVFTVNEVISLTGITKKTK